MALLSGFREHIRVFEMLLAALTFLVTWVGVETNWLPSWTYVGPVTLPPTSLYPVPLAVLVVAVAVDGYRRTGTVRPRRLLYVGLAALVLVTAAYAVVVLNRTSGGVFFAGLPPVFFGVLLAVAVGADAAVGVGRRALESVS